MCVYVSVFVYLFREQATLMKWDVWTLDQNNSGHFLKSDFFFSVRVFVCACVFYRCNEET